MLRKLPHGEREGRTFSIWQLVLLLVAYIAVATSIAAISWPQGFLGWLGWLTDLLSPPFFAPHFQLIESILEIARQM